MPSDKLTLSSLEWVVATYTPDLLRLAFVYTKNHADAEDIVQEVLLTYVQAKKTFPNEAARKAWLLKVTANRSKDVLRSAWRKRRASLPEELSYLPPEEGELLSLVLGLEDKYRAPLHLHYYEGYTLAEIAQVLRVRPATVGSWLHRGRKN